MYDLVVYGSVLPVLMKQWALGPVEAGAIGSYGPVGMMVGAILFGIMASDPTRRYTPNPTSGSAENSVILGLLTCLLTLPREPSRSQPDMLRLSAAGDSYPAGRCTLLRPDTV